MKLYRKKPVVIEAAGPLTESNLDEVAVWAEAQVGHNAIVIDTLEGAMRADLGDYVIKGVQGEFYPCKPDIFRATYEELI